MSLPSMSLPSQKPSLGALSQAHEILVHNQWSGAQLRDLKRLFTNDFFRGFGNQTPHLPAASTSTKRLNGSRDCRLDRAHNHFSRLPHPRL